MRSATRSLLEAISSHGTKEVAENPTPSVDLGNAPVRHVLISKSSVIYVSPVQNVGRVDVNASMRPKRDWGRAFLARQAASSFLARAFRALLSISTLLQALILPCLGKDHLRTLRQLFPNFR